MQGNILLTGGIPRLFILFVIPSVISMVLVGIEGMVDGFFLGNFVGTKALASVNIASPYLQIILGYAFIICTGTLSSLGRALGSGDMEKSRNIFRTAYASSIMAQFVILLAGTCFAENIASFLGSNKELLPLVSIYIRIIALFAPIISFMILCGFMGRLIEKPHLYLIATVCCLISNITLNYIFICIFSLNTAGAALATGLSYSIGLLIVVWPFIAKQSELNIFSGKFDITILKSIIFNGSSEGINFISTALILFIFNRTFMTISGTGGVAAFTAINYIGMFAITVMFGISDGIGSILSYNHGAMQYGRVRQTLRYGIFINFFIGLIVCFMFIFFSKQLAAIFISNNYTALELAATGAKIYGICFLFAGYNIICSGYYTSIGNAITSGIVSASRGIVFIVVGIIFLPKIFGECGIWATFPFSEIITFLICLYINKINFSK